METRSANPVSMTATEQSGLRLSDRARAAIWRVFGAGFSPMNKSSTYDLIGPVIEKHLGKNREASLAIGEIRGWFESHGGRHWIKQEKREPVAAAILDGAGTRRDETAIWAVGSIDAEIALGPIRLRWSEKDIDAFVAAALDGLEKVHKRDKILDTRELFRPENVDRAALKFNPESFTRGGRLQNYWRFEAHGFELVFMYLHPAIGNLIRLVLDLRPEKFTELMGRLDHPVVQTRAAHHVAMALSPPDYPAILEWIAEDACDGQIALAIVHALAAVNRLDDELRSAEHIGPAGHPSDAGPRRPPADLEAVAVGLLNGVAGRLAAFTPRTGVRWFGELLSHAPFVLHGNMQRDVPRRVEQLEKTCTETLAGIFRRSRSFDLLGELVGGLSQAPQESWTRHIPGIAWEYRETQPALAARIARAALDEHERQVTDALKENRFHIHWDDWRERDNYLSMGCALVLADANLDLPAWVKSKCAKLPLSVWDAEGGFRGFMNGETVARHWFLVVLYAIQVLAGLGCCVNAGAVDTLAEAFWEHSAFAGRYLFNELPGNSVVAELAARTVVAFEEPGGARPAEHARHPGAGPVALLALADQVSKQWNEAVAVDGRAKDRIMERLISAAVHQFDNGDYDDPESLRYWGRFWLRTEMGDRAERTATEIAADPAPRGSRADKILTAKLLALAARDKEDGAEAIGRVERLRGELWPFPAHIANHEKPDLEEIDRLLGRCA